MKIKNRIGFRDSFLRKMTLWICKQLKLSSRKVGLVEFKKRTRIGWRGFAFYENPYRVQISVGPLPYPYTGHSRGSKPVTFTVNNELEMLIKVTAHELQHIKYRSERRHDDNNEIDVQLQAVRVLKLFQEQQNELTTAWQVPDKPKGKPATVSVVDRRAKAASDALAKWQRKAKLAATKVKKYKARVKYYERKAAEKSS